MSSQANLLALPVAIPLLTAALCFISRMRVAVTRGLAIVGSVGLLLASLVIFLAVKDGTILVLQVGRWPAPFGITFVADIFTGIMLVLAGIVGLVGTIYGLGSIDPERERYSFHGLMQVMMMGVCGAFVTGDLFNLFVWFEVLLISSFVLLALGGGKAQMVGALKYVVLNLLSSAIFLSALGLLYGMTGTLNMADLSRAVAGMKQPGAVDTVAMLFLVAFGIKAGLFPLYAWLPASYHTPPPVVSAVFAGLLTKVGVYALVRTFTLIFVTDTGFTHTVLLVVALATMIVGVLGAFAQSSFRRVLSFHIISQIGYMVLGLAFFSVAGLAATVFYIAHHILVKTNLFLIAGVSRWVQGTDALKPSGGLANRFPLLAACFLISAFSLTGIPPLSGFFGKLGLVQIGVQTSNVPAVATALVVSLFTLLSMIKLWNEAFWKPDATAEAAAAPPARMTGPILALAALTLLVSLGAGPLYALATASAEQLMNPEGYIRAVLPEAAR